MDNDFVITRKKIHFLQKTNINFAVSDYHSFYGLYEHEMYTDGCDTIAYDIEMELTHKKNQIKPIEFRFIHGSVGNVDSAYYATLAKYTEQKYWSLIMSCHTNDDIGCYSASKYVLIHKTILINDENLKIIKISNENNDFVDMLKTKNIPCGENSLPKDDDAIFNRRIFDDGTDIVHSLPYHNDTVFHDNIELAKLFFNMTLKTNENENFLK